jgi:hypothetical protein
MGREDRWLNFLQRDVITSLDNDKILLESGKANVQKAEVTLPSIKELRTILPLALLSLAPIPATYDDTSSVRCNDAPGKLSARDVILDHTLIYTGTTSHRPPPIPPRL